MAKDMTVSYTHLREALGDANYSSNLFRFPGGSYGGPYEKVKKKARAELKKQGDVYKRQPLFTNSKRDKKDGKRIPTKHVVKRNIYIFVF